MSEENQEEQQGEKASKTKKKFHFQLDSAMKMLLKEISPHRLLELINALCETDYPLNSSVEFGNTENFKFLGDLANYNGPLVKTI